MVVSFELRMLPLVFLESLHALQYTGHGLIELNYRFLRQHMDISEEQIMQLQSQILK